VDYGYTLLDVNNVRTFGLSHFRTFRYTVSAEIRGTQGEVKADWGLRLANPRRWIDRMKSPTLEAILLNSVPPSECSGEENTGLRSLQLNLKCSQTCRIVQKITMLLGWSVLRFIVLCNAYSQMLRIERWFSTLQPCVF
jgi:hypothetical protein